MADEILDLIIPAVDAAIAHYCDRTFELTTYKGWVWSKGGRILYLPNYPIVELRRIVTETKSALKIQNTSADAMGATVQITESGAIYLNIYGGANAGNETVTPSAGDTLTDVKTDIEALGTDWTVTIEGGYEDYPAAELMPCAGKPAFTPSYAECEVTGEPMSGFSIEAKSGRVECKEGHLPHSKFVWIEYSAGYADEDMPADLVLIATRMVADLVAEGTRDGGLRSESLGDYSFTRTEVQNCLERYKSELQPFKRMVIV
jgi:hypothetical protein